MKRGMFVWLQRALMGIAAVGFASASDLQAQTRYGGQQTYQYDQYGQPTQYRQSSQAQSGQAQSGQSRYGQSQYRQQEGTYTRQPSRQYQYDQEREQYGQREQYGRRDSEQQVQSLERRIAQLEQQVQRLTAQLQSQATRMTAERYTSGRGQQYTQDQYQRGQYGQEQYRTARQPRYEGERMEYRSRSEDYDDEPSERRYWSRYESDDSDEESRERADRDSDEDESDRESRSSRSSRSSDSSEDESRDDNE